mmetsp:Transcript_18804/g.21545  ORF Transcript_18804/g.21545 Transcript_18804/m.21545 type:complete len:87 (+) Transcript_18804:131-391(+)|eukprot:CAMPEP_0194145524 /NCGR_PEP_ID=MMETSP0152-20130528/17485_1 /TAXON_ID=1049557 /ORGANISM="Thalassiothrix antarctica, Strain L6-D1" /LENGTH=86 /DNA_ID=CAMNT_0038845787 /DNA_START=118 /DNA_END=378 /DNA_ORIENTATION=-
MGNDISQQAAMMGAKAKMKGAFSGLEDLSMTKKPGDEKNTAATKENKAKNKETKEVYQTKQKDQKERVSGAKARWEANQKKKNQQK